MDYPPNPKSKRLPKRAGAWFQVTQKGLFDEGLWDKIEIEYDLITYRSPGIDKMI